MASIIKAGNATTGLGMSSDGTGTLEIKTGTGTGTNAITIDASQVVTIPQLLTATAGVSSPAGSSTINNLTVTGTFSAPGAGGNYIRNQYVAPATWTKPATLKAVQITVAGSGGPGGGGPASPGTFPGGSGGGTSIYYAPAASIPGPQAITAGTGTNSFGAIVSATAGSAGGSANGGTGSGGQINIPGAPITTTTGGTSFMGVGGRAGNPVSVGSGQSLQRGQAGGGYGGGGGGSGGDTSGGGTLPGIAGAPGIVIVEEFY